MDDYLLFTSEDYDRAALEDLQYMQEELDKKEKEIELLREEVRALKSIKDKP